MKFRTDFFSLNNKEYCFSYEFRKKFHSTVLYNIDETKMKEINDDYFSFKRCMKLRGQICTLRHCKVQWVLVR